MAVRQCHSCFVVYDSGGGCPKCGSIPVQQPVETVLVPEAEPASQVGEVYDEPISWSLLRWGRSGLVIALVVVASVVALDFMADRNQAAQASWLAQSQLGGKVDARRAELRAAVSALQDIYAEMVSTYSEGGMTEGERINWLLRWRERLGRVPVSYRLNINVGIGATGGLNARAEQNLRDAMLYLTSLERAMAAGSDAATVATLEEAFRTSLSQAREDLD